MNDFLASAVGVVPMRLELEWTLPDTSKKPSSFSSYATGENASFSTTNVIKTAPSELYDLPIDL